MSYGVQKMKISEKIKSDLIQLKSEYDRIRELVNFEIFGMDELEEGQIGYRVDASGASLISGTEGDWDEDWMVIGHETLCGDPIVMDLGEEGFPVFSLMHGMGSWEGGTAIADSLEAFLQATKMVRQLVDEKESSHNGDSFSPAKVKNITDIIVYKNGFIDSDSWESLFGPLLDAGEVAGNEMMDKVRQLKEEGAKIAEIAMKLGLSTKEVYEYIKALK